MPSLLALLLRSQANRFERARLSLGSIVTVTRRDLFFTRASWARTYGERRICRAAAGERRLRDHGCQQLYRRLAGKPGEEASGIAAASTDS